MSVTLDRVQYGRLTRLNLSLAPGLWVILGSSVEGLPEIIALIAGADRPISGSVSVLGKNPYSAPETRQKVAHLLASPRLIEADSVAQSLRRAMELRGDSNPAETVLARAGLDGFGTRKLNSLTASETRAVALALALSHPQPNVVALYEPFCVSPEFDRRFLVDRVTEFAQAGVSVVIATASPHDAHELGGSHLSLMRGEIISVPEQYPAVGMLTLRVTTNEPRRLAEQLMSVPSIHGVSFPDRAGSVLDVHGEVLEDIAESVLRGAQASGAKLYSLQPIIPSAEELYAARLGAQRAAYERAYTASRNQVATPGGQA